MPNFTWTTSYRTPFEGLPTLLRVPLRLPINASTPLLTGMGAVNRHVSQASEQGMVPLRKTELDHAQRLIERSTRYDIAQQQAKRVFHAAGIALCKRVALPAVDPRATSSAPVVIPTSTQTSPGTATCTETNTGLADGRQTSSTSSPVPMGGLTLMPHAAFNASFANTLIAPAFYMATPSHAYPWSKRYGSPPANRFTAEDEAQLEKIRTTYAVPAYELLSAIVRGMQLHENFLYIGNAIRAFATFMSTPARQTLNKSGEFFEVLARLNAMLAGKQRLTSVTLAILRVMKDDAVDYPEARMIDEALRSVTALQRAQKRLQLTDDGSVIRETTMPDNGDVTTRSAPPLSSSRRGNIIPTLSAALEDVSEHDATTPYLAPTIGARQIACGDSVERADTASLGEEGLAALSWLDEVPLIWAPDAALIFAWRLLPLAPYKVQIDAQIDVPANASMCSANGRTYIQMSNSTFRVEETHFGTLWVVGPEDESLPPLPIVKLHDGWDFALPDDETYAGDVENRTTSSGMPTPSEDGFVRWRNQKLICYGDQLRPVDASYIHGEERIRAMAIPVMERLDQPDTEGILWGPEGRRLIEGQYGYYPLLEGQPRIGSQGSIYRIAFQGRASMAEVSFDRARERWYVLGAQRLDAWFSDVFDPANDIRVAHRLLSAGLALRLDATRQALGDAPFLQTRTELREALRSNCAGLVTRILRFQSGPSTWSLDEQERLRSVWSALTSLLPAPVHWQQMVLVERQLLLAENVALFYDQFAPSFPLHGVLHQVQMTALGMDGLDGTLPKNAVVQLSAQLISADGLAAYASDMLLYVDSPTLLTSFLHPRGHGDEIAADAAWHRVSFAAWLYDNRASVALINFSARGGLCSFEHASSVAQVADAVDLFLWEKPSSEGLLFVVSPRNSDLTDYISHA